MARITFLSTIHAKIPTPIFMPVGTRGVVKTLTQEDLESLGAPVILANTYHLYLRPGHELIKRQGGLHAFMSWQKAILTDSGGYQVFSLKELRKISDEGVEFQSHLDGSTHFLSPQKSMEIQKALGSDMVMAFDECPELPASDQVLEQAVKRTLKWAKICRNYPLHEHQKLFGIIQGGLNFNLRKACLEELQELSFDGYALGGLSVGEKNEEMWNFLQEFVPLMPANKPRYLMGVGTPLDVLQGIKCGLDMFDCVFPTRNARNGQALTSHGPINLKNARFQEDQKPLDSLCGCRVCQRYSRAYIRHLVTVGEFTAGTLLTYHNLHFYLELTRKSREAIEQGTFDEFYRRFYNLYTSNEI